MSPLPPPPPHPGAWRPPSPASTSAAPKRRAVLICAGIVTVVALAVGATVLVALAERPPSIDSEQAALDFENAVEELKVNIQGAELDGCPNASVEDTLVPFIRASGLRPLYDPLDRGKLDSFVVYDGSVERRLLFCLADAGDNVQLVGDPYNVLGLLLTTAPDDFGEFTEVLVNSALDERQQFELTFQDLGEHAGGELHTAVGIEPGGSGNIDFHEIAWLDEHLMVVFTIQGHGAPDVDPELLRQSLIDVLPATVDNVIGFESVEPLN